MNTIYFLTFKIKSSKENFKWSKYKDLQATFWIKGFSAIGAYRQCIDYLRNNKLEITRFDEIIINVKREMFLGKDIGLEQFDKAQGQGFSVFYTGVDESLSEPELIKFESKEKLDIATIFKYRNSMDRHKFCLHPMAGNDCDKEIINAHSIQNNQSLSNIAQNGHVYQLSERYQPHTKSYVKYEKIGVRKASVFKGFCKKHDNEIFESIDNNLLEPNPHQVFLYAYRSLCKEIYQKYKVINFLKENISLLINQDEEILNLSLLGNEKGYQELLKIKQIYDETYFAKSFDKDILYLVFYSAMPMNIAFSSLIYPDYDFQGNLLQDLADLISDKDLITYFSAPMSDGWGYVFAWHIKHNSTCRPFIASLIQKINVTKSSIGEILFEYMILNSENHALSPNWWESLKENEQSQIIYAINHKLDLYSSQISSQDYDKIPNVSGWIFDEIKTNIHFEKIEPN